jgi:antirestriction protein ArdC
MATIAQPTANRAPLPTQKRDFRQEVTDNLAQMLEKGVAPWQKPWDASVAPAGMPTNPTTGRAYRGGNTIHLMATAMQRQYEDPRWMTYKQAAENGWQISKGEKGTQIEFWEVKQGQSQSTPNGSKGEDGDEKGRESDGRRLIHRVYTVFNAAQVEGIPPYQPKQHSTFEVVHAGDQILQNSEAKIIHDQTDRAFYSRAQDSIHLPSKNAFKDAAGFYGTALHELAHWSGHPSRLNRQTLTESYRFGDVNYAKEELRAELASVFLAAERGIPHNPEQHAAYVENWIKALKEDKNEIFRAAHDASKAADFLLALERDRSVAEESLQADQDLNGASSPNVSQLEQETAKLERDREQLEVEAAADIGRESTNFTTRFESGSATVNVHDKHNGTDTRAVVDTMLNAKTQPPRDGGLAAEHTLTTRALGNEARTYLAQIESGTYRGQVLGETAGHVVQRVSARSAVAHPKESLERHPNTGESVTISYSNGQASVRDFSQRSREHEMSR